MFRPSRPKNGMRRVDLGRRKGDPFSYGSLTRFFVSITRVLVNIVAKDVILKSFTR